MKTKLIGSLLTIIIILQIAIMLQLSDHDKRMETRHAYAISGRNAIRDQLDYLKRDIRNVETLCKRVD